MISYSITHINNIIHSNRALIDIYSKEIAENLFELCVDGNITGNEQDYILRLLDLSDQIIVAEPNQLEKYKLEFDAIIPSGIMKTKRMKPFRDKIIQLLGYSIRRSDFYPSYFQSIGIKACVYCNSQLTVSIDVDDKNNPGITKSIAKHQVDHYLPKSHYPCFSVSLFNLYPVCASCNNCKRDYLISFSLYENVVRLPSKFKFEFDEISKADYLLNRNIQDLIIYFREAPIGNNMKSFDEVFSIKEIYNTQKDIVAELILKAEMYSVAYKNDIIRDFPEVATDVGTLNQLIIGNYINEQEIHKRPMAKFMQDIAKQLKLI